MWRGCLIENYASLFAIELEKLLVQDKYSLTSPYGHLYNTDTSLYTNSSFGSPPEIAKIIHSLPL